MPFVGGFRTVGFTQSRRRYPAFIEGLGALTGTDFVRHDGTTPLSGTWNVGAQRIQNVFQMIIGTATDLGGALQVVNPTLNIECRNVDTDGTDKLMRMGLTHKTNAEQPLALFYATSGGVSNRVHIGGGNILLNAATQVSLWLAATFTTVTGTEMFRATSVGVRIQSGVSADAADLFEVVSAVGTSFLIRDVDGYPDFQSTTFGLGIPKIAGDPATLVDGDFWYDTVSDTYQGRENGVTVTFTTT